MRYSIGLVPRSMLLVLLFPIAGYGDAVDRSTPQAAMRVWAIGQATFDSTNLKASTYNIDPDPPDTETKSLCAREGYVVSGLLVDTDGTNVTAVRLTCMRLRDNVLDPSDKYQPDWIGVPSKIDQQKLAAAHGQALVGIFGRRGLNLDALGVLFGTPRSPASASK